MFHKIFMNHSYLVLKFKKKTSENTLEILYCLNLHEASSRNSTDSTRISGEMVVKIHIRIQNAPGPLWQRSAFLYITFLMSNDSLKPWENKKGQTFVVMLVFYMSFFAAGSWLKFKKRHAKNKHHNKNSALLDLSELYYKIHFRKFIIQELLW